MRRAGILFIAVVAFFTASQAYSQMPIVSAEQVKSWIDSKQKIAVIDVRSADEYIEGHIPGSINIPAENLNKERSRLPKDQSTRLIFYCRGVGWTLSQIAAGSAMQLGYTYVMIFQGGMPEWLAKGYPVKKGRQK